MNIVVTQVRLHEQKLHACASTLNIIVPGGCTKFIQAADVVWNASFKSHMRQLYDDWLSDPSQHEYTRGGNMKAPARTLLCEWVKQSWAAVSTDMVKESFVSCAITTSIEGTDDYKIHCFKPDQPCAAGRTLLREETEKARETPIDADDDPFASDEDEAENENNEATVSSRMTVMLIAQVIPLKSSSIFFHYHHTGTHRYISITFYQVMVFIHHIITQVYIHHILSSRGIYSSYHNNFWINRRGRSNNPTPECVVNGTGCYDS